MKKNRGLLGIIWAEIGTIFLSYCTYSDVCLHEPLHAKVIIIPLFAVLLLIIYDEENYKKSSKSKRKKKK